MDFKINQKRSALSIPYVRTHDTPSEKSSIFGYRTSYVAMLFLISLLACFAMLLIYANLQSEEFAGQKHFEYQSEPRDVLLEMEDDETILDQLMSSGLTSVRLKRQIHQNMPDCRGRQEECRVVLEGVRGITKSTHQKLDRLQQVLVQKGILQESDPKDAKFRKIVECLQCRNAAGQLQQDNDVDALGFGRNADRISELLPFLESHAYADDGENELDGDERTERIPKTPVLSKQVLESVTNSSKLSGGAKITEILHNTTIVEKDEPDATRQHGLYNARPVVIPPAAAATREESQVTRNNMDATPIILPTAETTKTSQQIQFSPQSSWPSIPVCFYGPPSSNSYQFKQPTPPFFPPFGQPGGAPLSNSNNNQQVKFFYPNGQPAPFPQSPNFPQGFNPGQQPQIFPQRNSPYYCTYIPAPASPQQQQQQQQQQFPFIPQPNLAEFQRQVLAKAKDAKSTYDESDEKYYAAECSGFWCNPPYKKCIAAHERCDGKVDCMGAEDEIDCPYIGYYSRFQPSTEQRQSNLDAAAGANFIADEDWKRVTGKPAEVVLPVTTAPPLPVTDASIDLDTTPFDIAIPVLPPQFACKRIIQTIPLEKRCDNVYDCEDTSDEEDCTCKDYLRYERPSAVCDGRVDCFDGSDEQGCDFCEENQYHCHRSGGCIPKHKRCDQHMDCKLNEDELDCFALTDGQRVNVDMDGRPHLNLEGVLTRYDNGVWRASCFKPEYRNFTKRAAAAQKICEYLGFKNVESAEETTVKTSRLTERSPSKGFRVLYDYPPQLTMVKREDNATCHGMRIRCKPILDRKLNVHLKIDPKTKNRDYLWPWEASVFVDGKYHCSAVLLENDLLLGSSQCADGIDLHKNFTTALMGVSTPDLSFDGPYQQSSQVVDIKPVKNSDASLFRLRDGINMTRYVQPLYLEKRIFPAASDDTCVALGVNDRRERKMQFLQPIVDNCPKCHRCYAELIGASNCSRTNETTNWSGNVVCLSNGGWYPAAVFQDKDEHCGFSHKQILNSIDYIHAHLSQAIDENVQVLDEPKCEGIRCSLGQCIPWDRVCDGVRECRDGADESPEHCQKVKDRCMNDVMECKCSKAELRCSGDGKCLPKEKFCDGSVDCADGSDEPAMCSCAEYLRLTDPKRVCDGRRHCLDKSDEHYQSCLCKDSSFKCHRSPLNDTVACIPQDFVCDGEIDCPNGEDEAEEACWTIKYEKKDPKGKGEVMRKEFGVFHSECFPRPIQTQREVTNVCTKLGYKSGILLDGTKLSDAQYVARNDFYMFQLNNYTWMSMRGDTSFGVWRKPESSCYRLFVHCF